MKPYAMPTAVLCAALGLVACASTPALKEFPQGARVPSVAELNTALTGKSFDLGSSGGGRVDYDPDGKSVTAYFSGRGDKGTWRAQDGVVCFQFAVFTSACNDVRFVGQEVYLKRSNGQVVQLVPR